MDDTNRGLIIEPHMRTSVDNNKVVLHKSWFNHRTTHENKCR